MSLFSKVSSSLRNLVGVSASQKISSGANKALTVLTSPIQAISNFKKAEAQTAQKGALKLVSEGVVNTLAVVAPFTSAGKAAIVGVAKTLVPKTAKGVIASAVAIPVAASVLTKSEKARSAVLDAPSSLSNFGTNIATVIENPSVATAKQVFTDNPIIAGGAVAAAVGGAALALAPVIASTRQTEAIQEQTEQIGQQQFSAQPYNPTPQVIQIMPVPAQTVQAPAVVAPSEAAPAVSTPKKKKKKPKKKAKKKKKTRRSKKKTKKKSTKKKKKTIKRKRT